MMILEDNDIVVRVPESWQDVTLDVYETFREVKPTNNAEKVALVAKICSTDAAILMAWPSEIFDKIVSTVGFVWENNPAEPAPSIKIDGVTYLIPIEDKLTLGAYIDADEAQKEDRPLANVLAITCRPAGEAYNYENVPERANMFGAQSMADVQPLLSFFLHCKEISEKRTKAFTDLSEAVAQLPRSIRNSQNRGGGINLSTTWRSIKYGIIVKLLKLRLLRFLRLSSSRETENTPRRRKGN